MTHDELLEEMSSIDIGLSNGMVRANSIFAMAKALRAVVELHKPYGSAGNEFMCEVCENAIDGYPCHTIQAIEKELKNV